MAIVRSRGRLRSELRTLFGGVWPASTSDECSWGAATSGGGTAAARERTSNSCFFELKGRLHAMHAGSSLRFEKRVPPI